MLSSKITTSLPKIVFAGLLVAFTNFANASLTQVGDLLQVSILVADDIGGNSNDCSGYFGSGFEECKITHVPSNDSTVFAEIMGKFEGGGATQFADPSKASDWSFHDNQANPGDSGTGTWQYVGTEYPGVSYWVAKAGSAGFILNWMIADNVENRNTCASPDEFSVDCLSLAISVTSGTWTTPLNTKGGNKDLPKNLSHISFYGNLTTEVAEPHTLALFALALFGIVARRKNSHS